MNQFSKKKLGLGFGDDRGGGGGGAVTPLPLSKYGPEFGNRLASCAI